MHVWKGYMHVCECSACVWKRLGSACIWKLLGSCVLLKESLDNVNRTCLGSVKPAGCSASPASNLNFPSQCWQRKGVFIPWRGHGMKGKLNRRGEGPCWSAWVGPGQLTWPFLSSPRIQLLLQVLSDVGTLFSLACGPGSTITSW